MKSRARGIAIRLARTVARKSVVILSLSSLAIVTASMGIWAHSVYAAKAKVERAAQQQAATLNDVMAKLNLIESEMQRQTRTLDAKLEALEYQNAKLATYEVRDHAYTARLELAAARMPIGMALPGAYPQTSSTLTIPLELETKVCHKGSLSLSGKIGVEPDLKAFVRGNVGLDEFGDGVEADARGQLDIKAGVELGGDSGFEKETCLDLAQFNIFGQNPPTVNVGQFISGITSGSENVADKLAQIYLSLPQLANSAVTSGMDALANVNLSLSPQKTLQALDNPQTAFQDISTLVASMPMPGNLRTFFTDPSSLFPQPSDLDPANFCANFSGGTGPISNICSKIPSGLADLNGITTTIGNLGNVQGALTNFKTGLTQICGDFSTAISTINNTSINIPQLKSFSLPDGLHFHTDTIAFVNFLVPDGLSTHTVSIGPQTINSPFQLQPLSCSSF
ncbi:MAG: hypothetical protein ACHP8A_15675 [Terriglobales bacterium]